MNLTSVVTVLLCVVVLQTYAGWVKDLTSPRGLDIWRGLKVHLDDTERKNSSLLERHALRLDYGGLGVSVSKAFKREALELGFYVNDKEEGRGQKMANMVIPLLIGFKLTGGVVMLFLGMKLLVIKALGIAKLALIATGLMMIVKLVKGDSFSPSYEFEHHGSELHPVYTEYGSTGPASFHSGDPGTLYTGYSSNYGPSAAESALHYATVEAPGSGNLSAADSQQIPIVAATKRKDHRKKYHMPTILTVRRYSVET